MPLDRRIFAAVREDDEDLFVEICGDGEEATCDINYADGYARLTLLIECDLIPGLH